jgi:glycosyltransferase involved in cell wall biosynthesis
VITFAVSMVKDEADVIEGTLRHLASEVDRIIVADNGSTDGTIEILDKLTHELPLEVIDDQEPAYYQSEKMSRLAARAARDGATWIVPFDADEIWYCHWGRLREVFADLPAEINVVPAKLYNHFATALDPAEEPDPFRRMMWRQRQPGAMPKVAFRWERDAVILQGNHGIELPSGAQVFDAQTELRHFPYRSAEQMVRKARNGAAAYAATTLSETAGAHWRQYGALLDAYGEHVIEDVFREHFWFLSPVDADMVHDPAPYLRWPFG